MINKDGLYSGLDEVIFHLQKMPGIGQKSAARIAFHLLDMGVSDVNALAQSISDLRNKMFPCGRCGFPISTEKDAQCHFCDDKQRNQIQICIVEKPQDILSIEKTGIYQGLYHSIGGLVSPLDGVDLEDLRIESLLQRVRAENISEILFALSPTMEGEATALYIAQQLKTQKQVKTQRLSLGLPMGTSIEYADSITLSRAILSRIEF